MSVTATLIRVDSLAPADEANERIRAFMVARAGRPLWPEERAVYERLLEDWVVAVRHDVSDSACIQPAAAETTGAAPRDLMPVRA